MNCSALILKLKQQNAHQKPTKVVIVSASYNVRHIAGALGVECIPKSTALKCLSAYKEALGVV